MRCAIIIADSKTERLAAVGLALAASAVTLRAMRKGGLFFGLLAMLAACAPQHVAPPRAAGNWPASKRIQRVPAQKPLPPARPLPPPKPAWVARDVVANAAEVAPQGYVVQPGDTLRRISDRLGASSEAIARANGIAAPFVIRSGQALKIPGGRYHRVQAGETGIAIARAYGVPWSRVIEANQLDEPYVLRDGQKLLLPSRQEVAAMSMEDRARAFRIDIADLISGGEPAAADEAAPRKPVQTATAARTIPPSQPVIAPASIPATFAWPLKGSILSSFGAKAGGRFNDGINIKAAMGEPVRAAADGVVAYADSTLPGFGGLVLIKHGGNIVTAYAHAEALLVARGQAVKKGDIIAKAGETGSVDEPQLHFEIRQGRKPINPLTLLPARG